MAADYYDGLRLQDEGDLPGAVSLWHEAANTGDGKSLYALAQSYEAGQGVARHTVQAYVHYALAINAQEPRAAAARDRLAKSMSNDEIKAGGEIAAARWEELQANARNPGNAATASRPEQSVDLFALAQEGNVRGVKRAIKQGQQVNKSDNDGWSPLMHAALHGHIDVVNALLQAGATPNHTAGNGATALMTAAFAGHDAIVQALIRNGADPKIRNRQGQKALDIARFRKHARVVAILDPLSEPDCDVCPEMVIIPSGRFLMGSPVDETGRKSDEGPQHTVQVKSFALSKTEITFDQWDACVQVGGCNGYRPDDKGWGRGRWPVIHVSWIDAQNYVAWLSRKTGNAYRLPSEAEWEFAARAGKQDAYWWANQAAHDYANYGADQCCSGAVSGRDRWINTAPVGSFPANPFGLHDMHGNVWEWVEDCENNGYENAPIDGSAWITGDCSRRQLRGGSWSDTPAFVRSAYRDAYAPSSRYDFLGFRVARTLP